MTLNYRTMVERYPKLMEKVGDSILDYEIFSLLDEKLARWSLTMHVAFCFVLFYFKIERVKGCDFLYHLEVIFIYSKKYGDFSYSLELQLVILKLNRFICNELSVLPIRCTHHRVRASNQCLTMSDFDKGSCFSCDNQFCIARLLIGWSKFNMSFDI